MEACGGCNQEETSLQKHCPGMQERKVKTQLELQLMSDVKSHKKDFYRYTGSQKENQGYHGQLTDIGHEKGLMYSVPSSPWSLLARSGFLGFCA